MTKRSNPDELVQPIRKRLRSGDGLVLSTVGPTRNSSTRPDSPPPWARDPQFYYEDGSVILLVESVLFKVQASLLKNHSEVFRDMFAIPLGNGNAQAEGLTDEHPIMIPGITAAEFQSLLKMFYLPPSDKFFISLRSDRQSDTKASREFAFYSDVARLSHRFCMPDFEKWAVGQLASLISTSAINILTSMRKRINDDVVFGIFFDTLAYAQLTSNTSMEQNLRHAMLRHSVSPEGLSTDSLLELLHRPGLREEEPAMFGFWFLVLLSLGHQEWQQEEFTKEDRIALFSAQAHLTPLPKLLGKDLNLPILARPKFTIDGHLRVFDGLAASDKCHRRLSRAWRHVFDSDYYDDVLSNETRKLTSILCKLPRLRSDFADAVGALAPCSCNTEVLEWLDDDIQHLFMRVAGYYQDIN